MSLPFSRKAIQIINVLIVGFLMMSITMPNNVVAQEVLPRPEAPFAGKIGLTYKDSEAVKPKLKIPAAFGLKNPPNILI